MKTGTPYTFETRSHFDLANWKFYVDMNDIFWRVNCVKNKCIGIFYVSLLGGAVLAFRPLVGQFYYYLFFWTWTRGSKKEYRIEFARRWCNDVLVEEESNAICHRGSQFLVYGFGPNERRWSPEFSQGFMHNFLMGLGCYFYGSVFNYKLFDSY